MSKRIVVPTNGNQKELFEFMLEELGGEEAVMRRFYKTRILQIRNEDGTVGDLVAEAQRKGWSELLNGMTLKALHNLLSPTAPSRPGKPFEGGSEGSGRMTKAEVESVKASVLEYLGKNEWSSKAEIARALNLHPRKLGPQLKALRDDGKVQTEGQKAGMKYSLV